MRSKRFYAAIISGCLVLAGIALFGYMLIAKSNTAIPKKVVSKLSFKPYVVEKTNTQHFLIDKASIKFDDGTKVLSYVINSANSPKLTVSEQDSPVNFAEIPELYPKLIDSLHRYSIITTPVGTVYLTHPKGQNSGQTAVVNGGGVLMFVRSDRDISDDGWKTVFNNISQQTK